jgi:hypothetical protein
MHSKQAVENNLLAPPTAWREVVAHFGLDVVVIESCLGIRDFELEELHDIRQSEKAGHFQGSNAF